MLRVLIVIFLIILIVSRVFRFFSNIGGSAQAQQGGQGPFYRNTQNDQPTDGNVHIDYIPEKKKGKRPQGGGSGGEYIDYEEVQE